MRVRVLSILLTLCLIIGIMPVGVRANTSDPGDLKTGKYGSFVDGNQVIKDMITKNGKYAHPRIIMTEDKFAKLRGREGERNASGELTVTGELLRELRGEANRYLSEPVATYELTDDHLVETSKRIQRRVAALALAYNIFGDEKYAVRCYQELEAACKFKDWSPVHFLDTAEMCTAFAYGYDWLYNWMTPEQRKFLRKNMIEKGLMQVMQDYTDTPSDRDRTYKWYEDKEGDNWQLVCTGGTNLVALAIGDEDDAKDIAASVLTYGYKRAYTFVRHAYDVTDGTYIEGLGYWDYATYYLGLQSSALKSTTGTDYGLTDHEGIYKSVEFIRYMSSNYPYSFSFGDDGTSRDTGWAVFMWLGEHFNSPELAQIRHKKIKPGPDHEFNYLDVLWIDESKKPTPGNNPTDWGVVGGSNASFRNTWDVSGTVAALHTGLNDYMYHGHFDLGSFYIESNGSRFFTDLGNEKYKLDNRKVSYRIKAEGHNTLVINPTQDIDQRDGANCLITKFKSGNVAYAVTDLTDAYTPSGAKSVVRGLKMIKDKECVVIQDEISLNAPGEIYWFAHTKGQIDVASDGRSAIVTVGSDKLWVGILSTGGKFTVMDAIPLPSSADVPGASDNSEYRKLAIHFTNTKDTTITVACIPLKNGATRPSWTPSVTAISEWSKDSSKPGTPTPTAKPTSKPTAKPTAKPTSKPSSTVKPTAKPTARPTTKPTPTSSEKGVGGFIERLYTIGLDRASDPNGKADWVNLVLTEGYTGADVAKGFLFSPEFLKKDMSDSDFLDVLYKVFFDRSADAAGKADWMNRMANGYSKEDVILGFINSTEWANICLKYGINSGGTGVANISVEPSSGVLDFATRLYTTCLGRKADPVGLGNWSSWLANLEVSGSEAAHGFFFSKEFLNAGYSNEEYVTRLYRTFMGREPDAAGFNDWVSRLNNGASREFVFDGFAGSKEWAGICAEYGILK